VIGSQCSRRGPHKAFGALKVTNLGKQILMNSYMILLWRRPEQNLFNCLLCYVQPYL